MSAKPEVAEAVVVAPVKSKKMLVIIIAAVLILALGGGAAWFFLAKKNAALEDGDDEEVTATASHHEAPKGPPTYLPLDNMVVNLADPGGEKVAQVGITLELADVHAPEVVKPYLPAIRSGILLLLSQRTAEELLQREGKEKLAADILTEASRHFGPPVSHDKPEAEAAKPKKKKAVKPAESENPVRGVLFSSFIVQ